MATQRGLVFLNESYYHVFNRGIERRTTFLNKREYTRALDLLSFYQFNTIPIRYSRYAQLPAEKQQLYYDRMVASGKSVEVVAFSLMPNHFHLLLRQKRDQGITRYVSNFVNAYTKYFNTKHERVGPLFQGVFKAVYVETDEQLVHLTRYIHLNPVVSSLITKEELDTYLWSSYPIYLGEVGNSLIDAETIKVILSLVPKYKDFVMNQVGYAKELEKIKHMILE
jgi:putative transposase